MQMPAVPEAQPHRRLRGKRVAMLSLSLYPGDPRPRRAAQALRDCGMDVDFIGVNDGKSPSREALHGINVLRLPIEHKRGGKLAYAYEYSAFIFLTSAILAKRSLSRKYDLVYINNMPDVLVISALFPKLLGAKVILDLHDPMPELMTTIFGLDERSLGVRLMKALEKWSIGRADLVLTVNRACQKIFGNRSCSEEKIGVIMNSPDSAIFPFQPVASYPERTLADSKFVIMYHGSIVERNGLDLIVDSLESVLKVAPNAELRIYGHSTPFLDRVMKSVEAKGLQKSIVYFGPRTLEQLSNDIRQCDVGVVPNHKNAFTDINTPTRIFEYLALGKPVIAPRTVGITDYFSKDALLYFDSGNAPDLASAISFAFRNPAALRSIAELGQQIYQQHTWSRECEKLVSLIDNLLAEDKQR
jgi:glycosyltransferase involved in cell wall biosynthesis